MSGLKSVFDAPHHNCKYISNYLAGRAHEAEPGPASAAAARARRAEHVPVARRHERVVAHAERRRRERLGRGSRVSTRRARPMYPISLSDGEGTGSLRSASSRTTSVMSRGTVRSVPRPVPATGTVSLFRDEILTPSLQQYLGHDARDREELDKNCS